MMKEKRPQPVNWGARIIAASSLLLNGTPPLLLEFEVIDWTASQVATFQGWAGGVALAAIAIIIGQESARRVTPTSDPRDDGMAPLVPTADDWIDD